MRVQAANRAGGDSGARTREPLVGRVAERRDLLSALARSAEGHGDLFLVAGEPGIGKTRLVQTVAEDADGEGHTVLWGGAWESGGAPAFWPWTEVIRGLLDGRPTAEISEDLGHAAAQVAQIVPELGRRLSMTVEPGPSLDSEAARFTAFDATRSFLCASALRQPLVIVLEDLHAADIATVRLLEFLARSLHGSRILAIGTHRPAEEPHDAEVVTALADLGKTGRRMLLCGLTRNEVRELTAGQMPEVPPPRLVDRLHALTEGNPLFVDEVLRLLVAEGALPTSDAMTPPRLPVPERVRETLRRRIAPLQPAVARALAAAAVMGPEFRVETLARVINEERATLLGYLDEAAAAELVEESPGALGRYRFSHPVIRETLYEDLSV
jgi:predicted ATPase